MTKKEETAYDEGYRMAWTFMLIECLRHLGYEDPETQKVAWIKEREQAIHQLRSLCEEFGDNDWNANLHLADIIEKHLGDHLFYKEIRC